MGNIDKETVQKIKDAANIVDVIGDYLELKKKGIEYQTLCPFHEDHTIGNFSISPAKNIYKCFSCGASGDPIQFLMEYNGTKLTYNEALRYLAKKYDIYIDEENAKETRWEKMKPAKPRELKEVHKEMLVIDRQVVANVVHSKQLNMFIEWFRHLPWSNDATNNQRDRVKKTLHDYCVGPWKDGRVAFWQIDHQGRPRSAKLMRYETNGHRDKNENPGWIHNQDGIRDKCDLDHHEFRTCPFGMHLLKKYPNAVVNVVESEKTALICANAYGHPENSLWLAVGGIKFLKPEVLQPIIDQGRNIWLWPDKDGVNDWTQKCKNYLSKQVRITTKFIDQNWIDEDGPKADVADIIVRHMTHPESYVNREPKKTELFDADEAPWDDGTPFLDAEELADPVLAKWRQILRDNCKSKNF
jgi:hypothetical protein